MILSVLTCRYADVVVHRQLLAALKAQAAMATAAEAAEAAKQAGGHHQAPPPPAAAPPPMEHAELSQAAHMMNERHRGAKAAQKECTELFMLDLLHRQPHVESALVVGVHQVRAKVSDV